MTRPTVNLAAGRRYLGARAHARLLDDQTESLARVLRADERVIEIARLVGALHIDLRHAEKHMVAANQRATDSSFEPPVASMKRRRSLAVGLVLAVALSLPSLASAHTGSVACTDKGVVFSYASNFSADTIVTETVTGSTTGNGVVHSITVPAHTATSDTVSNLPISWPTSNGTLIAEAHWSDNGHAGSIGPVTLTCTFPPVTPDVCIPTQTVTRTVYTPGPETIQYIDVPGATQYVTKWRTRIVHRVKWRTRIKLVPFTPFKPKHPIHKQPGVTG